MARHPYACGTLVFLGTLDSCVLIYRQLVGDFGRFTGQQPTSRVPEGGPDGGTVMEGGLDALRRRPNWMPNTWLLNIISRHLPDMFYGGESEQMGE